MTADLALWASVLLPAAVGATLCLAGRRLERHAAGLAVLTAAYAVGHLSGGHFNPAITLGLAVARRFPLKDVPLYVVAQVAGGSLAGAVLYGVSSGKETIENALRASLDFFFIFSMVRTRAFEGAILS